MNLNLERMEGAGGATDKTHVTGENPSKRLDRSPVGDSIGSAPEIRTQPERIAFNQGHNTGFVAGRRIGRDKIRAQKRELRRLNRVIQQMSWKLHRKRDPEWASIILNPVSLFAVGGVAVLIAMLVFM